MNENLVHEGRAEDGRYVWYIEREALDREEGEIYDAILPKLSNPSPDQLHMLAAYAYAASEFKKSAEDKDLADYLRRCMIYARNGLGLWKPVHISEMELLLDHGLPGHDDWPYCFLYLASSWQFGEDK